MNNQSQIVEKLKQLTTTALERKALDTSFHFVPVNLEVLNITLGGVIVQNVEEIYDTEALEYAKEHGIDLGTDEVISLQELKNKISAFIKSKHSNSLFIRNDGRIYANAKQITIEQIGDFLPATVVRSNGGVVGALYSSYNSTYDGLFRSFLNTEISKFLKKTLYKDTNYKVGFDVGHIFGDTKLAKTPLGEKLKKLFGALSSISDNLSFDGIDPSYIKQNIQNITTLKSQVDSALKTLAAGSTYGKQVEAVLFKDFPLQSVLLSVGANVVVIQDRLENQAVYAKLLEGPIGREIIKLFETHQFSRSLIQEVEYRVTSALKGTPVVATKATQKLPTITSGRATKPKVALDTKSSKKQISESGPKFRTKGGQFSSLASLQQLINSMLAKTIKQNMGTGNRKDILNLRTGRLAESVKVERMSQSRDGMITAFYSYMRNPYGTFSQGGQREFPRSRDPKLLIAESIREIAAQQVKNRLRAVLV